MNIVEETHSAFVTFQVCGTISPAELEIPIIDLRQVSLDKVDESNHDTFLAIAIGTSKLIDYYQSEVLQELIGSGKSYRAHRDSS